MKPYYDTDSGQVFHGHALDVLKSMPDESVQMCVTSPPYWGLRSYMPNSVVLKKDAPKWVIKEIESLGISPIDNTDK